MRRAILLLMFASALACGDDEDEKEYPPFSCDRADWDCEVTCANLRVLCDDPACQVDCTELDSCVSACGQVKLFPLPFVTATFNCAAEHGTCGPYTACVSECVGFGGEAGSGGGF